MLAYDALALIPLLPLVGAALIGLLGSKTDKGLVNAIALSTVLGAFAITVVATVVLVTKEQPLQATLWSWMAVGRFSVDLAFRFDQLTAALMLVVTGVGFLIHVYSTGYMEEDPSYARYFAYLNLFIAMMSTLVLGASLPVMFIGWEGVGLASYLLIGFWYTDEAKAKAGRKAFIVNRIGDFGFLLGILALAGLFGTVDFTDLREALGAARASADDVIATGIFKGYSVRGVVTFACISLFVGACGKSAQIPLYVWLPDAMAGPTPVSALIHAATMVTAGVYMVARMGPFYDVSPTAGLLVAWVGGLTAVFSATIGLAQDDIKKVLAYSTVSQLGYMFLAAGLGAYAIAMFHVVTHAFFKACLFLGSGAIIHALHGEQDMRKMGALKDKLPAVFNTFALSTVAIAGFPGTSGFFSKDAILAQAHHLNHGLFALGLCGAFLTAFYMARLFSLTFLGPKLRHPDAHMGEHLHLPGKAMWIPLWILAILATFGGLMNIPTRAYFEAFLFPVVGFARYMPEHISHEVPGMAISVVVALSGLGLGYFAYRNGPSSAIESATSSGPLLVLKNAVANKWYVDEIYDFLVVRPIRFVGSVIASLVDPWVIDGVLVKLVPGVVVKGSGRLLRLPQTGNVQTYATFFAVAAAVVTGVWAMW